MDYLVTFLEGIITFVSPCLLPMLPIYVAYFAGDAGTGDGVDAGVDTSGGMSANAVASGASSSTVRKPKSRTIQTLKCALGFVVGFSLLFTLMGAFAGTVGSFFLRNAAVLNVVCGAIVILLGLNYLGILRIPVLQRTLKPKTDIVPRSFASSLVFGFVFAIGWTPCVGAFLGSALSLAATSANVGTAALLLLCYSLGLGIPFVLAALLIDQLEGAFTWVKRHYDIIDKVCGVLLVVVGALMATGLLGLWLRLLS